MREAKRLKKNNTPQKGREADMVVVPHGGSADLANDLGSDRRSRKLFDFRAVRIWKGMLRGT